MLFLFHNPVEGIGSFYGGVLHPLLVPEQALLLLSCAACLGQQGLASLRRAVPVGLLALLGAVFLQPALAWVPPQTPLLALAALLGLTVAAQLRLPRHVAPILAALVGLSVGFGTDALEIPAGEELLFQVGAVLGAGFCLLCFSVWFESAKRPWQRIVVRVLGSWTAAASLIVLAWQFLQA
jgi:urease accessory protein